MNLLCGITRRMPLILCVATPLVFFVTYAIALANGHVSPLWPYISDTGTQPPESCVFGLLVNLVAFALCTIIYLRYREVSAFTKLRPSLSVSVKMNRTAATLGFISCFGLSVVASFQETNQLLIHLLGALMCFVFGTVYFLFQTIFTYRLHPEAKIMLRLRATFTTLCVFFIIGTFAPVKAAMDEFKGKDILKWTSRDGGYVYHLISTCSEWLLVFSFCGYMCTFFWDFRKIQVIDAQIEFLDLAPTHEESAREGTEDEKIRNKQSQTGWI